MKKFLMCLALLAGLSGRVSAGETYSGTQVAPEGAWCWFADPRAIHYENADKSINASYLAYIDVHGNVKATQYDFNTGKRSEVLVRSYFQPDDHNNPTFLVLPDERILIIYSRHTDEPAFYYRVSKKPGDITDLGEEKKITTANNTTYPSPFILSDDPEHFYLCWRGIGWHPTIAKFTLPDENDNVKTVYGPYQMVQSTGARPYAKYTSNGKDKIYVTYTTGHPDNEEPNWLYCNVVNINAQTVNGKVTTTPKLEDIKGNVLSTIANGTFAVNKDASYKTNYPYAVVDATPGKRDWVWQIVLDKDNNPVIPMVKISSDKSSHIYHLAKWDGSKWNVTELANGGGKFHSSNTEYCYSGGEAIDPENPNTLYLSIPTAGDNGNVFEIWKYTVDDAGKVTNKEQITKNSQKNNVRPYVLNNHGDSPLTLAWMNGDYYYWMVKQGYPLGYPTSIQSDYAYAPEVGELAPAVDKILAKDVADTDAEAVALNPDTFTLSVDLTLDKSVYGGTIFQADGFKYEVNKSNQVVTATVGDNSYVSQNKLLTSDDWALYSTGTTSDYHPTKLGQFNLTLTYDGKNLTIYRDGVIDQVIPAENLNVANFKIGGFKGKLNDYSTFDKVLNQDEIKAYGTRRAFATISIPGETSTDLVLPDKVGTTPIIWTSSNPEILKADGTFRSPATETVVVLTMDAAGDKYEYNVTCKPRNIGDNLLAYYQFETTDTEVKNNVTWVRDHSGHGNDLYLQGSATVDGRLNLEANKSGGFSTNGYAVVPAGIVDGLRSYTIKFTTTLKSTAGAPRFYDFGVNSGNSFFCRANTLCAGIKYMGGNTTMQNGNQTLKTKTTYDVAVTFDARTHITTIYIDGKQVGSGTANLNEPYMLAVQTPADRNYIGRTQWWDSSVANDNQDIIGTYDNFCIYNTCLSAEEVQYNNPTGVAEVSAADKESANVYDLSGTLLIKDATDENLNGLKSGIYLHGGKKVIVR